MKVGLYFGSFNPIHNGHLIIATHIINYTDIKEVWLVVSPQNPLKKSSTLLHEQHRLNLAKTATEGEFNIKVSNIEFKLPRPSYTIDTLTYLKEKYPQHQFTVIMGGDSFTNLPKWKNHEKILEDYRVFIYNRPGFVIGQPLPESCTVLDAPLLEISSTHIRELLKQKKSIRYLVPDMVRDEIFRNNYYGAF